MTNVTPKKHASESVWTWILITLLWGSVFFFTSTWMLGKASVWLDAGAFQPDGAETMRVYKLYAPVLVVIALVAKAVKSRLDPGALKQLERQKAVKEGKRERYFVSFAGGIASSFLFTLLAAIAHLAAAPVTGAVVKLSAATIAIAGVLNIAAGLGASLLVGMIFLVSGVGRGSNRG
jgi:hypothetical protein